MGSGASRATPSPSPASSVGWGRSRGSGVDQVPATRTMWPRSVSTRCSKRASLKSIVPASATGGESSVRPGARLEHTSGGCVKRARSRYAPAQMSRNGPAQPKRAGRLLDAERFERVVAPGATTLLRLSGRLHSRAHSGGAAPILVVGAADGGAHRYRPLPGPVPPIAGDGLLAAFAVPAALLDGGEAILSVELAPGFAVGLNAPEERALRATDRVRELEAEVAALRERADEADELLAELDRLREARLLDAAAHESTADAFERAQAEHSEVQDRLAAAQTELTEDGLPRHRPDDERTELAARVEELEAELLSARAGADELLAEAGAARADAEARLAGAEARLAGAEERIAALMTSVH